MKTDLFRTIFSILELELRFFLEEMITVDIPGEKTIYEFKKKESYTSAKPLDNTLLFSSLDPIMKETGTELVPRILWALFPVE